jgi:hypothetical protein
VGDVAIDSSGNGRDGSLAFGPVWVDGKFGKALEFNGKGSKLAIDGYFGIGGNEPRSVVFWWKGGPPPHRHSWVKWGIIGGGQLYQVKGRIVEPNTVLLTVNTGGAGSATGTTNVCDDKWHHIAVVLPSEENATAAHQLYVDGVPELDAQVSPGKLNTENQTNMVHIGSEVPGIWQDDFARGIMDEVAIIRAPLSEADINAIMTQGFLKALAVEHTDTLVTTWAAAKMQY